MVAVTEGRVTGDMSTEALGDKGVGHRCGRGRESCGGGSKW